MTWKFCFISGLTLLLTACEQPAKKADLALPEGPFVTVLGIAQDAGYPQAGCTQNCCAAFQDGSEEKKNVSCLALVDPVSHQYWLLDATPDIGEQLSLLQMTWGVDSMPLPAGILLTHAHIGHYTGLMQLGREAMGAREVPVYAMPGMDSFLRHNGPWSQLVSLRNIEIRPLQNGVEVPLNKRFSVTALRVPHRDEYSETVGFLVKCGNRKLLYIPDIDKWEKWDRDIRVLLREVDYAFLDGTFYQQGELPGRDMKEIPHPFVTESMQLISSLTSAEKARIIFIHFNHTNPLLKHKSAAKDSLKKAGFGVAEEGMRIGL